MNEHKRFKELTSSHLLLTIHNTLSYICLALPVYCTLSTNIIRYKLRFLKKCSNKNSVHTYIPAVFLICNMQPQGKLRRVKKEIKNSS